MEISAENAGNKLFPQHRNLPSTKVEIRPVLQSETCSWKKKAQRKKPRPGSECTAGGYGGSRSVKRSQALPKAKVKRDSNLRGFSFAVYSRNEFFKRQKASCRLLWRYAFFFFSPTFFFYHLALEHGKRKIFFVETKKFPYQPRMPGKKSLRCYDFLLSRWRSKRSQYFPALYSQNDQR